jgi:nucleoside-diphosphate-sugar epimerase
MNILVTGSAGHLGKALCKCLKQLGHDVVGLDVKASPSTDIVTSITDAGPVRDALRGIQYVLHTATLHKPHVATHSRQAFIHTNLSGTLNLLEASLAAGVQAFIFTSTTSMYGDALRPPQHHPAVWVTEATTPIPRNIYGVTKLAAEDLCRLFHRDHGLPVLVLRTSRFFPDPDALPERRADFDDLNLKVIELLHRRVDLEDVVSAHLAAMEHAARIGFGKFIVSATSPFTPHDLADLRGRASQVVRSHVPAFEAVFRDRGWSMLEDIDRVYVNDHARTVLGWSPRYDFARAIDDLAHGRDPRSPLALEIGSEGYHTDHFTVGMHSGSM